MFTKSAAFYDAIYSWKDYAAEAELVVGFVRSTSDPAEIRCSMSPAGRGSTFSICATIIRSKDLDLDARTAQGRAGTLPDVPLHQANMVDFELGKQFDVVTCLFSASATSRRSITSTSPCSRWRNT